MTEILLGMLGAALMLAAFALGWILAGGGPGAHLLHARGNGGGPAPTAQGAAGPSPTVSTGPDQTSALPDCSAVPVQAVPEPGAGEITPAERARALEDLMSYDVATAYGQTRRDEG